MEKYQGMAKLVSISSDELKDYNEENDTERVLLSFQYVTEGAEDNDLQSLLEGLSHNNTRTVILDLSSIEGDSLRKKIASLKEKIGEHTFVCTTYVAQIAELNEKGKTAVKNNSRTYRSFNRSYVGKYDDEKAVLAALKDRLTRSIEDGDYEWAD